MSLPYFLSVLESVPSLSYSVGSEVVVGFEAEGGKSSNDFCTATTTDEIDKAS